MFTQAMVERVGWAKLEKPYRYVVLDRDSIPLVYTEHEYEAEFISQRVPLSYIIDTATGVEP